MKSGKPSVDDLHQLLGAVKETIEAGRLPPGPTEQRTPLLATALVRELIAQEPQATGPDRARHRADFAQAFEPALTAGHALVGVLAEPSLLFSNRQEDQKLRQRLLAEERLLAVIDLPPRLLRTSGVGLCVLVLVPQGMAKDVMLVDASAEDAGFFEPGAVRGQARLFGLDRLAAVLVNGTEDWWFTRFPASAPELLRSISPSAHLRTPVEKQVGAYFRANGEVRFADMVDMVGPLSSARAGEPGVEIQVVNAADVPALGVVKGASGQRTVPASGIGHQPERFLRPGDLLINFSSAAGIRIAVVPETAPPAGAGGWAAARTVWVYRPRAGSQCNAHALAMMLASPLGAHLLHQVLHGRAVVSPRLLLELCFPAVDAAAAHEAAALFDRHQHYEQQIRDLTQRQSDLAQQLWPLPASPSETRTNP